MKAAASLRLLHVFRVKLQAVVDQVLHLLSDDHHQSCRRSSCDRCAWLLQSLR